MNENNSVIEVNEAEFNDQVVEASQKKLIIVDDDTPFRERLGRSMEKKGFNVVTFSKYSEALKR